MPFNTIIKGICKEQLSKSKLCLIYLRNTQPLFFQVQKYEENLILVYVSVIMLKKYRAYFTKYVKIDMTRLQIRGC